MYNVAINKKQLCVSCRLYAFDVHCNSYLPLFLLLYGALPFPSTISILSVDTRLTYFLTVCLPTCKQATKSEKTLCTKPRRQSACQWCEGVVQWCNFYSHRFCCGAASSRHYCPSACMQRLSPTIIISSETQVKVVVLFVHGLSAPICILCSITVMMCNITAV